MNPLHKAKARLGWTITIRDRHVANAAAKTARYDQQIADWSAQIEELEAAK